MMRISLVNHLAKDAFDFVIRRRDGTPVGLAHNVQRSAKVPKRDWTRDISQKLSER
jgi:hypothetical protein